MLNVIRMPASTDSQSVTITTFQPVFIRTSFLKKISDSESDKGECYVADKTHVGQNMSGH